MTLSDKEIVEIRARALWKHLALKPETITHELAISEELIAAARATLAAEAEAGYVTVKLSDRVEESIEHFAAWLSESTAYTEDDAILFLRRIVAAAVAAENEACAKWHDDEAYAWQNSLTALTEIHGCNLDGKIKTEYEATVTFHRSSAAAIRSRHG